eukprot:Skav213961  [mRNA]  locus=scaffold5525:1591:11920:- [translate_table: standard]
MGPDKHAVVIALLQQLAAGTAFTSKDGTHIFDLVQTAANLNRYYCMEAAAKGANFIMIGTKENMSPAPCLSPSLCAFPADHRVIYSLVTPRKQVDGSSSQAIRKVISTVPTCYVRSKHASRWPNMLKRLVFITQTFGHLTSNEVPKRILFQLIAIEACLGASRCFKNL